ncbi:MAG TPA: hypothetical protein VIF15_12685 [Polyangiaceae bacterium]|jgi:hypothetical protein
MSLGSPGCGGTQPTVGAPAVATSADPGARRPDAVVVEPPAAMPGVVARADARGVIALREPLAGDAVREVVQSLLDAWQRESLDALVALLTLDAGPIDARGRGRGSLVEGWRQRMHAHEYGRLSGVELVRPERIERWEWGELGASDAPARPADMRPDEVYVRVPLEVTRIAGEKLFDDVIVLVVRREDGKYKIAAYGETEAP